MKKSWLINLTIVCTIFGLLLSWQYNSFRIAEANNPNSTLQENLLNTIAEREANIQSIEEEIGDLRSQLSQFLEDEAQDTGGTLALLQEYLESQRTLTSLTPVSGSGIIITLNDNVQGVAAARADAIIFNIEEFLIHDWTLLYVVNELRAAGAVAISINNQRIATSSAIRCVGPVILINRVHIPAPFEIKAITLGNPEEFKNRIESSGKIPSLRSLNFPVEIEIAEFEIPEYKGHFRSNYLERGEQ